ncbi:MAG TPA: hypothetical protein VMZ33_02060 [Candidatus Limnocylindrales bacterium]|nr:hypothetical protein [Candidatus Limnocylindrales bacterium]
MTTASGRGRRVRSPALAALAAAAVLVAAVSAPVLAASSGPSQPANAGVLEGIPPPSSLSDFNHDGFDDLAIGAPFESVRPTGSPSSLAEAGAVHVLYGSANGLRAEGSQVWNADNAYEVPGAHAGDHFGWSVAVGNFDGDGYGDLAIGAPHTDSSPYSDVGAVFILFGSSAGLTVSGSVRETGSEWFSSVSPAGVQYGFAIAAADSYVAANATLDNDGRTELIVTSPGVNSNTGSIVMRSLADDSRELSHGQGFAVTGASAGDRCGESVAVGDFDNNDGDDVAIGCPMRDYVHPDSGCVAMLYNDFAGRQLICQTTQDVDPPEQNDHFGLALAAGDFDRDNRDDLVVGVPDENLGSLVDAGMVHMFFGASTGGLAADPLSLTQESTGVPGASAAKDKFGAALAVGDFDGPDGTTGDFTASLAIGLPGDDVGSIDRAGAAVVLYWLAGGMATSGNQRWTQDSTNVLEKAAGSDRFGSSLAAGRFKGSTTASGLAIGVPLEDLGGPVADAGALNVLYGSPTRLRAAGNQLWHQNSTGIGDVAEGSDRFGSALAAGPLP